MLVQILPLLIPILGISCGLVAIFGGTVVRPWVRFQERKLELEAELMRQRIELDAARSERLEQRMAVLERIVTDKGLTLSDEIERLRDAPLN
ncbi:MAG: hypothetical protein ACRCSO_10945 [Sphingomonas sp.]